MNADVKETMSEDQDQSDVDAKRAQIANEFNQDSDPLADFSDTFESLQIDPFEIYIDDVLSAKDLSDDTDTDYERVYDQFREHMSTTDRHPACPTENHVKAFAYKYRDEVGNRSDTVKKKVNRLNKAYEYWQSDPNFPHPEDYNPFKLALMKIDLSKPSVKEPPHIPLATLRKKIEEVTHIRDRAIIVIQLKLGLRAGEVANLRLQDFSIENSELRRFYPEIGSHWMLDGHKNAVYIPPATNDDLPMDGRQGNKSRRPRVLPLDDELRRVLVRYLLIRPDSGDPWIFLSKDNHEKMENQGVNHVWKKYFHPEYEETKRHRAVTSHFGRHFFSTFWRVEEDLNRDLIKYMRGDTINKGSIDDKDTLDQYVHTYYDNIEEPYRKRVFRLLS